MKLKNVNETLDILYCKNKLIVANSICVTQVVLTENKEALFWRAEAQRREKSARSFVEETAKIVINVEKCANVAYSMFREI